MIKLSYEQQQIVMLAFSDELEKLALWEEVAEFLPKLMNWGKGAVKAIGAGEGLDYLAKFKSPSFIAGQAGKLTTDVAEHEHGGIIQSMFGNSAHALKNLGTGVADQEGLLNKGKQILKNIYDTGKQQLTDARFKTVDLDEKGTKFNRIPGENGDLIRRNNSILPDRKILGQTATDAAGKTQAIIKKRLPMQGLAMTLTVPGMVLTGPLMDPSKEGMKNGVKDGLLWGYAEPIGVGMVAKDMLFNKKKDQNNGQTIN